MDRSILFYTLLLIFFCVGGIRFSLLSQPTERPQMDSIPLEDTFELKDHLSKKKAPRPGRAALLSAILPGAGQFYNKSYLKMPFVYGGLIGLFLVADQNRDKFRCYRYALTLELEGLDPGEVPCGDVTIDVANFNAAGLRSRRDNFRKNMEMAYIGMSLVYVLNVVDAYVDAHLQNFDINDDLSLQVNPYINSDVYQPSMGVTLTLRGR